MDYKEAVALAKQGDERGYGFLYETTYKSKYYLALQYMKNEEAAQDVLQEAYIRAFTRLDMLTEPEAFPGWLGRIVANTAKNMLVKKNPMLFSQMETEEEGENFEYRIEDDSIESQPELSYTRQETQELVREMIDSLSEEQRMCILLFHIEGASIREIAATLGCSENTVKSRLNYGRQNLKKKAEELQKKGYKLYSVAPLPLFLYLLRSQAGYLDKAGSLAAGGKSVAQSVFGAVSRQSAAGSSQSAAASQAAAHGQAAGAAEVSASGKGLAGAKAAGAAKAGFLHTTLGKVAAVTVGVCLAGGAGAYGVYQILEAVNEPAVVQEQPEQSGAKQQEQKESEQEESPQEVKEEDYPNLIAGNLTQEELEFVLAYGPQEIPTQGLSREEAREILNNLCEPSGRSGGVIEEYGPDAYWRAQYSLADVNRMFSSFSDYQFTEENDDDGQEYGVNVEEDKIVFAPATISWVSEAAITRAEYTEDSMEVYYTYSRSSESGQETTEKKAVLKPNDQGAYRIVSIEEAETVSSDGQDETAGGSGEAGAKFPVGEYSYVAPVGGLRTGLTIEESGIATIVELMSGTGESHTYTYQITAKPGGGDMTTYVLSPLDGGDERILTYEESSGILHDETAGFDWTPS